MGWLYLFSGVDGAVFAGILLLCINEVLSVPKEDSVGAQDDSIGQGIKEPTMIGSSVIKMFNRMSSNMAHGMGRMHPAGNQMHDQSDNLYKEVQRLHDQLVDSHKLEEEKHMLKRESRVQVRSASTSQAHTILRIQSPCAGTDLHSRTGSSPSGSVRINPRSLLQSLSNEAMAVQKVAEQVLRLLEAEGVNRQVAFVLGQEAVLRSGLRGQAPSPAGNDQVSFSFAYFPFHIPLLYLIELTRTCHALIVLFLLVLHYCVNDLEICHC